jgi:glycosyltransferase involved in cell wall biosynthesis
VSAAFQGDDDDTGDDTGGTMAISTISETARHRPRATVSVVIPVRDDRHHLQRCLDALSAQTHPPFEFIVVDNASSDDSAAVAARYGAVVLHESEVGIPAASATGYDAARGEFIARVDADSVPGPTWIASVCELLERHPELAAVTGGGTLMDDDGRPHLRSSRLYMRSYFTLVGLALGHPPLWGSSLAMRRTVWNEVRSEVCRHDARMHDDIDLSIHIGPQRRIAVDRRLTLAASASPLALDGALLVRFWRGLYTIVRHWPREFPLLRWLRRQQSERAGLTASPTPQPLAPAGGAL